MGQALYNVARDADVCEKNEVPADVKDEDLILYKDHKEKFIAVKRGHEPPVQSRRKEPLQTFSSQPDKPYSCALINPLTGKRHLKEASSANLQTGKDATNNASRVQEPTASKREAVRRKLHESTITFSLLLDRSLPITDLATLLALNGKCTVRLKLGEEEDTIDGNDWRVRSRLDPRPVPREKSKQNMFVPKFINASVYDAFSTLAEAAGLTFAINEEGVVVLSTQ